MKKLSDKQIERLAEKNRNASQRRFSKEMEDRGISPTKTHNHTFVDNSKDPNISTSDHRTIFQAMKKLPYHS